MIITCLCRLLDFHTHLATDRSVPCGNYLVWLLFDLLLAHPGCKASNPARHVTQPSLAAHAALPNPGAPAQFCFQLQAVSSTRLSWSLPKKKTR